MQAIEDIEVRNKRVDADKVWEISWTRRAIIALVTYVVAVIFLQRIGIDDAHLNALVPAVGYILSTL